MMRTLLALSCLGLAGLAGLAPPATANHVLVSCDVDVDAVTGGCDACGYPTHECHPCQPPGGCGPCGGDRVCECSTDPQCVGGVQYGMVAGPVSFCVGATVDPSNPQDPVTKWYSLNSTCTGAGGAIPVPIGVPGPVGMMRVKIHYELP